MATLEVHKRYVTRTSKGKQFLKNFLLLSMSLVIALLCSELLVRYTAPQKLYRFPKGMFIVNSLLQYSLTPNFHGIAKTWEYQTKIDINSIGLREDREYGSKTPGTYRILALGDSFAMGVGVNAEQTYVKVLERLLGAGSSGPTYEVINAGVPGYNTRQEILYLQEEGLKLEPDLVLLNFYVGNDVHDNVQSTPPLFAIDGYLQNGLPPQGILPHDLRLYLARESHLYNFIWPYQRRLFDRTERKKEEKEQEYYLSIYDLKEGERTQTMWDTTSEQLRYLVELTKKHAIKIVLVLIPDKIQIDHAKWIDIVQNYGKNIFRYKIDNPNKKLIDLCENLEIPVLNLLPAFARAKYDAPLYLELDGHWTVQGNTLAAETVYAFLRAQQFLTP